MNRRETLKLLGSAAIAGAAGLTSRAAFAALGPIDVSKVRTDITAAAAGKKLQIATVVKVDGIAWFDRMREGIKEFSTLTGHDAWMVGPSHTDAAEQVQLIENLIAQGVDAICVVPFSVEAVEPVLKKARDRGIVVVGHEASNLNNADFIIEAFDNKAYGAKLMSVLGEEMGGEGEYVATVGSLTSQTHNEWVDGAIDYQKAHYPNMKLAMDRIETYDDANQDYTKLKEALTTDPKIKGILGAPMPTSAGAGRLIAERGLKGKLFFAGTGLVSVAGEYLKSGDISYIQFWDPAAAGIAMSVIAAMAVTGKKAELKEGLDLGLPGYGHLITPVKDKPGLLYGAGWVAVTKDNMAQYNF
jgi:simple sugar transport system substrate-binding protein